MKKLNIPDFQAWLKSADRTWTQVGEVLKSGLDSDTFLRWNRAWELAELIAGRGENSAVFIVPHETRGASFEAISIQGLHDASADRFAEELCGATMVRRTIVAR